MAVSFIEEIEKKSEEYKGRRKVVSAEIKELTKDQKVFTFTSLVMGSLGSFVLGSSYFYKEIMGTQSMEYALGSLLILSSIVVYILGKKSIDKEELKELKRELLEIDAKIKLLEERSEKQLKMVNNSN